MNFGYSNIILVGLTCISIISAIATIIIKNPIISVLSLIVLFITLSCYLISSDVTYIGLAYILVYVGAISILFLFILMLINIRVSELVSETKNSIPLVLIVSIIFLYAENVLFPHSAYNLLKLLLTTDELGLITYNNWENVLRVLNNIVSVGNTMFTVYAIYILIVSIILLLAMIGAIVITVSHYYFEEKSTGNIISVGKTEIWKFIIKSYLKKIIKTIKIGFISINVKLIQKLWINNKDTGILYIIFALFSGLVGTAFSVLIRLELSAPGVQFIADNQLYNSIITAHAIVMIFFMVMPAMIGGFGNFLLSLPAGRGKFLLSLLAGKDDLDTVINHFKKVSVVVIIALAGLVWTSSVKEFTCYTLGLAGIIWLLFGILAWIIINNNSVSQPAVSLKYRIQYVFINWQFSLVICIVSIIVRLSFYNISLIKICNYTYILITVFIICSTLIFVLFIVHFIFGLKKFPVKKSLHNSVNLVKNLTYANIFKSLIYISVFCIIKQVIYIYIFPYLYTLPEFNLYMEYLEKLFNSTLWFVLICFGSQIIYCSAPVDFDFPTDTLDSPIITISSSSSASSNTSSNSTSNSSSTADTDSNVTRHRYYGNGQVGGGYNGHTFTHFNPIIHPTPTDIASITPIMYNGNLFIRIVKICGSFLEVCTIQMMWFFNRANLMLEDDINNQGRQLLINTIDFANHGRTTFENINTSGSNRFTPLLFDTTLRFTTTNIPKGTFDIPSLYRNILHIFYFFNPSGNIINCVYNPSSYRTSVSCTQHIPWNSGLSNGGNISDLENIVPYRLDGNMYLKIIKRDGSTISVMYSQFHQFCYRTAVYTESTGFTGLLPIILMRSLGEFPITDNDGFYHSSTTFPTNTPNPSVRVSWVHLHGGGVDAFPSANFDTRSTSEIWKPSANIVRSSGCINAVDWGALFRMAQYNNDVD